MNCVNVPVERIGTLMPNKNSLYRILVKQEGIFLPRENSKAISEEYLLSVLRGEAYSLKLIDKRIASKR